LDSNGWDGEEFTNPGLIGALRISGVIGLRQKRSRIATAYGGAMPNPSVANASTGVLSFNGGIVWLAVGGAVIFQIPIKIPERATLKKVRIDITPVSGVACSLSVYKLTVGTFGSAGPTVNQLGVTDLTAGAARQVLDSTAFTSLADISDISYIAQVSINDTDQVHGIEVTWEYDHLPEQFPPF
jgi:hypothetical protein